MKGSRIKSLREEKGIKQDELAKILSISPSAVGMYERDEREPNDDITLKLAHYFNVTTDYLLGKSDILNPENITINKSIYNETTMKHLEIYNKLNKLGKQTADIYIEGLTEVPKFTEKKENNTANG